MMKKRFRMSLTAKNAWTGRAFVLLFYIGFIFFFLAPLIQSIRFSFSSVTISSEGYQTECIGWKNYIDNFTGSATFIGNLQASLLQTLWKLPVILISSLFLAILLNQQFRGRTFIRAVFFLPAIVASGIVITIIKNDNLAASVLTGNMISSGSVFKSDFLGNFLSELGFGETISGYATMISNQMFDSLWLTGIQMIIFLAGLQSIPSQLYEVSAIEGATAWENFWMITIPMLMPIILVNTVYTIVDTFTDNSNAVMQQVLLNVKNVNLGWASSMAWTYFAIIGVILAIILFIFSSMNKEPK